MEAIEFIVMNGIQRIFIEAVARINRDLLEAKCATARAEYSARMAQEQFDFLTK